VKLNSADWGPHSHSLAATVRGPRLEAVLHLMLNAFWQPLDFELPAVPSECQGPWRRWIDTCREPPEDICEWRCGSPVTAPNYSVQARSLVVLIAQETHRIDANAD
jgi:glycogen operon protein